MSEVIHTSSSLVTAVHVFLLESSSPPRRLLSWHNLSYSSRQAAISLSRLDLSDASCSISAIPAAISRLTTNYGPMNPSPADGRTVSNKLLHCTAADKLRGENITSALVTVTRCYSNGNDNPHHC